MSTQAKDQQPAYAARLERDVFNEIGEVWQ